MTSKRIVGLIFVITLALAVVGCKKKPKKDDGKGPGAMAPAAMTPPMEAPMTPPVMKPATVGKTLAKIGKPLGMVVLPKGKNPLAGVDISKGFGEGWFNKGGQPASTPPATPATTPPVTPPVAATPPTMAAPPPAMVPVTPPPAMPTPAVTPAVIPTAPAAAHPTELPYAQYIHPDRSFGFRYPTGWTPTANVRKHNNVPIIIVQVRKTPGSTSPGELGALAFILPQKAPNAQISCQKMIAVAKQGTPTLKTGPLQPLQKTGLLMFQAVHTENNAKHVSLGICGSAHGRVMFLSYFSVGMSFGSKPYGWQLGKALYVFTSDLLKK